MTVTLRLSRIASAEGCYYPQIPVKWKDVWESHPNSLLCRQADGYYRNVLWWVRRATLPVQELKRFLLILLQLQTRRAHELHRPAQEQLTKTHTP